MLFKYRHSQWKMKHPIFVAILFTKKGFGNFPFESFPDSLLVKNDSLEDDSSSDKGSGKIEPMNNLSGTLSCPLLVDPSFKKKKFFDRTFFLQAKWGVPNALFPPQKPPKRTSYFKKEKPRLPVHTEPRGKPHFNPDGGKMLESVPRSQSESFQQWRPGRESPLLSGAQVLFFQSPRA
ncbi:hypothetical protein TNIN_355161 [Trichonephila inaurata madagascariensis]|uniref:Uncharacterized protein n=1 Tax=Trichonephila inaurata madagascariensis TaxID=2747483 RepID=A0A8X7C773_9ARAC|nr:hypothetical protein TNIN_355161 [Trichonephila inaurata madagascariensis]